MSISKIKFGNTTESIKDANAYVKPSGGIPKTDLASAVQDSLDKADYAPIKPGTNDYTAQGKDNDTLASGQYSFAYGKRAIATGQCSTAIGRQLSADGQCSIALGAHAVAAGQCSFVRGGNWIIGLQLSGSANVTTYSFTVDSADFEYFNRLYNILGSNELVNLLKLTYIRYVDTSYDIWKKITNATITASGGSVTGGTITLESTLSETAITNKSGYLTIQVAAGKGSISDGNGSVAIGRSSHAEGEQTIAQNQSEHAQGERNYSHKASSTFGDAGNTIYSIGIGTTSALNAFEIMQNGGVFVKGVGTYDGTNPTSGTNDLASVIPPIVNITWANLKSLRDNSQLVPGRQYRITDYHTTVSDLIDDARSADHQFDIIVIADAPNKLNENARAALHSGDTYFSTAGAKLEAWELKYCLDNDKDRFEWALTPHGAGILVPDFTSDVLLKTNQTITAEGETWYIFGTQEQAREYWGDEESDVYFACPMQNPTVGDSCYIVYWDDDEQAYMPDEGFEVSSSVGASSSNGQGVIYWMKDENDNECPYDLKNIQFKVGAKALAGTVDNVFYYTFSVVSGTNDTTVKDHTFNIYCKNNKIAGFLDKNKLTFVVFRNVDEEDQCHSNTFGNDCYRNTFGSNCYRNTFRSNCYRNTFGNYCSSNTFGDYCHSNTFGNDCSSNIFGNRCYSNTFGNICFRIKFGTSSSVKSYCRFIIVENGNQYIYLSPTGTTSGSAYYQNVKIAQGVNNTTTYKTITDPNVGQTSQTVYL